MTKQKTRSNLSVQYMTRIAILGALSAVLFPLEIPICRVLQARLQYASGAARRVLDGSAAGSGDSAD